MTETPQENSGAAKGVASHDPKRPAKLLEFMSTGWDELPRPTPLPHPANAHRADRRNRLAAQYPGEVVVVPSGGFKVRANDTDFPFRAGSDFTWLVGSKEPDAVL